MSNLAQGQNDRQPRHRGDFGTQENAARADLFGQRLVLRRHAACGIADPAVNEFEAVIRTRRVVAAGEADGPAACTIIKGELSLAFAVGFAG